MFSGRSCKRFIIAAAISAGAHRGSFSRNVRPNERSCNTIKWKWKVHFPHSIPERYVELSKTADTKISTLRDKYIPDQKAGCFSDFGSKVPISPCFFTFQQGPLLHEKL
jgi:hypothetical protein